MATRSVAPKPEAVAAVLANASKWVSARRKSDGRPFFFVQGSKGETYMADAQACTCPAARRYSGPCKHSVAIREHQSRQQAAKTAAQPAPATASTWKPCLRNCGALVSPEQRQQRFCSGCWERLSLAIFGADDDEPFGKLNPLAE